MNYIYYISSLYTLSCFPFSECLGHHKHLCRSELCFVPSRPVESNFFFLGFGAKYTVHTNHMLRDNQSL